DPRQKGLLWYSTYAVDFSGAYSFRNNSAEEKPICLRLKFPASQAVYDDLTVLINGQPVTVTTDNNGVSVSTSVAAGQPVAVSFAYRSQGMESWTYKFGDDVSQVRDFVLNLKTNFKDVDFGPDTLSPTEKHEIPGGWDLDWKYKNLLTGLEIGTTMPERLQPG